MRVYTVEELIEAFEYVGADLLQYLKSNDEFNEIL
jgi:hypothetical protein